MKMWMKRTIRLRIAVSKAGRETLQIASVNRLAEIAIHFAQA
jgi:hypothetical protein